MCVCRCAETKTACNHSSVQQDYKQGSLVCLLLRLPDGNLMLMVDVLENSVIERDFFITLDADPFAV